MTEDYYYPAPEADQILMRACGQQFHTTMDCVWGFSQLDVDEETSAILSTITPFGVYKTKKLPEGVKQGPSLFQHFQATALGHEVKADGHPLCDIFVDDTHVGDETKEKHFKSLERVLTVARNYNIQYRFKKCEFFKPKVLLLGFVCSKDGREADPKKVEQLRAWPIYKSCADINSHLAFCNYLREFFGPQYSDKCVPLRKYTKKGAEFKDYDTDTVAQASR